MRRQLRELGWGALGFGAAFLLFVFATALWGFHVEREFDRVTIDRPKVHRLSPAVRGGDALQPASAGQEPEPAGVPAVGGGEVKEQKPHDHDKPEAGQVEPHEQTAQVPASPTADAAPAPSAPPPEEEPESEPATERGLIGNPGGIVGEVVCQVNELGIRACTESG